MKIIRTTVASLAFIGAATTGIAMTAHAEPNNGPAGKPGVGCAVEDQNGNVSYVPIGTQVGLFHCGSDGEWHFGTVTTDLVAQPKPKLPKGSAAATRAAGTLARR